MSKKDEIIKLLKGYVTEMEGYDYCGSNPGIEEENIDEIADKIVKLFDNAPRSDLSGGADGCDFCRYNPCACDENKHDGEMR